jgi:hypothetical protein
MWRTVTDAAFHAAETLSVDDGRLVLALEEMPEVDPEPGPRSW